MVLGNRLDLSLSQRLVLTPQIQQVIKLLQMSQLELIQTLNQEIVENPFLEEEFDEEKYSSEEDAADSVSHDDVDAPLEDLESFSVDEYFEERGADGRDLGYFSPDAEEHPSYELFYSKKPDLYDHLLWQLRLCNADDDIRMAAEAVIGNIDEDGYLRATEEELVLLADLDIETVRDAIALIQGFDPAGVGAKSLQECLLLQLNALDLSDTLIGKMINNNISDIMKKNYNSIARQYDSSIEEVISAVKVIEGLEPRPGRSFLRSEANYIVPDVFISKTDMGYHIALNEDGMPKFRLNNGYKKLLSRKEMLTKEEKELLREKLRQAVELIKGLDQRNRTIYKVSKSLLTFQRKFFDKGIQYLKPLNLKEVASDIDMHESTISRVTSNKFLACDHGVISFRLLFSSTIQSVNGGVSSASVKDLIKKIIVAEDSKRPLSDKEIANKLREQNINIARRTIAKYRRALKIPQLDQRRRYEI
ncbi:RNA polymerase factor sigma-54 [Thermodesulfovibrionales bacterium]|nr:RNA polymerase factor sigma-54 [Thermodesulfovibrionales bacterium]MCL0066579.1 RNA polymerase factor sigma-54 [Thermodesulfovibrionales bacterium]